MLNTVIEYQLPSPSNNTVFTLSTIAGNIVGQRVQGSNVFMSVFAQGPNPPTVSRTFKWLTVPASWDDDTPTELDNFFAVLAFPSASWVLLTVQIR